MVESTEASGEALEKTGLRHRVFLPVAREGRAPLAVLVHGRTGDSRIMWHFAGAVRSLRPIIVTPEALLVDPQGGYTWWNSSAEREKQREGIADAVRRLQRFVNGAVDLYGANPRYVYAIGFSLGGTIAAALSLQTPSLFRGVALLASFIPQSVMEEHMGDPSSGPFHYFIAHGERDDVVPLSRAHAAQDFLTQRGADVRLVVDDVGHKIGSKGNRALREWFRERAQEIQ